MGPRSWLAPMLGSGLVLVGLVVRDVVSTTWPWLAFNLVLAWIPVLLGTVAARRASLLVLLGVPWLLFLPNAPYLLTDLIHLRPRAPVPLWFDVALLGGTGALGVWMGALSVHEVACAVGRYVGRWAAGLLILGAPLLSGFGMYLGRFLRWNSWDLVTRPGELLRDVAGPLLHPARHLDAWAFTLTFGGVFLVAALATVRAERPRAASRPAGSPEVRAAFTHDSRPVTVRSTPVGEAGA